MGSVFHLLCPRYSGILTLTTPMAIRLWETFTFLMQPEPGLQEFTNFLVFYVFKGKFHTFKILCVQLILQMLTSKWCNLHKLKNL